MMTPNRRVQERGEAAKTVRRVRSKTSGQTPYPPLARASPWTLDALLPTYKGVVALPRSYLVYGQSRSRVQTRTTWVKLQ